MGMRHRRGDPTGGSSSYRALCYLGDALWNAGRFSVATGAPCVKRFRASYRKSGLTWT